MIFSGTSVNVLSPGADRSSNFAAILGTVMYPPLLDTVDSKYGISLLDLVLKLRTEDSPRVRDCQTFEPSAVDMANHPGDMVLII